MYNINAPHFPEYIDDEFHHLSTICMPAFVGMQITNGPYGAISKLGASSGETHACAKKSLDPKIFRTAIAWVIEHNAAIKPILLGSLVDQYWEMREIVIDCLIDEDPDVVVPEIRKPEDLAPLCGLVALHIGSMTADSMPIFGIELGCNWEEEHGAGVRFEGLKVIKAGHADEAFSFPAHTP